MDPPLEGVAEVGELKKKDRLSCYHPDDADEDDEDDDDEIEDDVDDDLVQKTFRPLKVSRAVYFDWTDGR